MSTAIRVENISKAFRIGTKEDVPDTLYGAMVDLLKSPFRKFRQLRDLNTFREQTDDDGLHWALRDVSFDVENGEVLGIIGRNGAGKSTILKILSGITEPTSGQVSLYGAVSSLLEVGTGFHPELTGRENVYLNGTILGMTKREIDRKFDAIIEFSGTEKFLDTPIKRYSSGMQVRLAFAVAAHLEPEILLVDEVLAVGDLEFQRKCIGRMREVASDGRTVIFVSHDVAAVQRLCSRAILLSKGEVAFNGPTDDCLARYLQSAHGNAPLNLLECEHNQGKYRFHQVEILDTEGNSLRLLKLMQPFAIRITFEAQEDFAEGIFGLGIHNMQDVAIFATHTNDFGQFTELKKGTWQVTAMVQPNFLREGRYYISLGAVTRGQTVSRVPQALEFDVEPILHDPKDHYDHRIGMVFYPMKWTVPKQIP